VLLSVVLLSGVVLLDVVLGVLLSGVVLLGVVLGVLLGSELVGADEAGVSGVEIGDVGTLGCGVRSSSEVFDRLAAKTGTARTTVAAAASAIAIGCFMVAP
jgi:hypothetical protein